MRARFARSGSQGHPSKKILDPPMRIFEKHNQYEFHIQSTIYITLHYETYSDSETLLETAFERRTFGNTVLLTRSSVHVGLENQLFVCPSVVCCRSVR